MHTRPFTGPPGYAYVQNGVYRGDGVESREGSIVYVDTADGGSAAQRGRLLVPFRDPRGYRLLFAGRDVGTTFTVQTYMGRNALGEVLSGTTQGIGFPTFAVLPGQSRVLVARPGDPLRVIGVDDGGEPYMEDVRAQDRETTSLDVDPDDNGPYLPAVPRGAIVVAFEDRVMVIDGNRVYVCNVFSDFEGWPAANQRDVDADVRAAAPLGDALYLHHLDAITRWTGDPANGTAGVDTHFVRGATRGCAAPRSLVEIDGWQWFLSQSAEVCRFNGAHVDVVTAPLWDLLRPQMPLSFDPIGIPRVERPSIDDACAVWFKPWGMYVVFFEGETAGVYDLGIGVDVASGRTSILTGIDAQAMAVMVEDDARFLTYDRLGVIHAQNCGVVDTLTTAEALVDSVWTRTHTATRVPFIGLPNPRPPSSLNRSAATEVGLLLSHRDARAPTARPVVSTIGLHETRRIERDGPPQLVMEGGSIRHAGYLADETIEDPNDFVIGTTPVAPDGFVDGHLGLSGARGHNHTFVIRNDVLAEGETDEALSPDQVGIVVLDVGREP